MDDDSSTKPIERLGIIANETGGQVYYNELADPEDLQRATTAGGGGSIGIRRTQL